MNGKRKESELHRDENSSQTSRQSSTSVFPSRKRRSRNSQELYAAQAASGCFATNGHGKVQKKFDLSCVVCTAVAHGYNFDAISCESCKAFFRRNALFSMERFKCRREGNCEITMETRRRCKSCRLSKCFVVGMRKEWILTEEEKISKKRRIEENKKLRVSDHSPPTNDRPDKSDLDLQTALSTNYDRPLTSTPSRTPSNDILNQIVTAYNDGIHADPNSYAWSYPLARKMTALNQIINTRCKTALRLISFYKKIPDFDILTETDKICLIKSNLHYMFLLHASLHYDPKNDICYHEIKDAEPVYGNDIREAYGTKYYSSLRTALCALHSLVQIDERIMQVALVIFLFSKNSYKTFHSNDSSVTNPKQIFCMQNKYVERLWIFLETTYGERQSTTIFSILTSKFLLIQDLINGIEQEIYGKLDIDQVPSILRSLL